MSVYYNLILAVSTLYCIPNYDTGQVGSEWEVVDVANNSQRGTNERIREKMLKISEKARAAINNSPVSSPQGSERALQERVEGAIREERLRALQVERRSATVYFRG